MTYQRQQARADLLDKLSVVCPEAPRVDHTLQADTLTLYDALVEQLGIVEFGQWLTAEYPWLEKPETALLRVWWVLQRKHDEVMGIEHRGLFIIYPEDATV